MLGLAVNAVQSNALIMLEFGVNAVQSNATSLWLRKMQLTSIFTAVLAAKIYAIENTIENCMFTAFCGQLNLLSN
jgi:hypothetical protein